MKLADYWSRAEVELQDRTGVLRKFACWRWSNESEQRAHAAAQQAAKQILEKISQGQSLDRYGYGDRPMREEVHQRFLSDDGSLAAAITQNGYGSLVLNTARILFIDVDSPSLANDTQRDVPGVGGWLRSLFRKPKPTAVPAPSEVAETLDPTHQQIVAFFAQHPDWSARLYRTAAGYRVLVTHALFSPEDRVTRDVFTALAADPLYVRLCRTQQCFRARLTPKPWRCDHYANTILWPRVSAESDRLFEAWHREYLDKQSHFATCRLLADLGHTAMHPEVRQVVEIHDRLTRCEEPLPLA